MVRISNPQRSWNTSRDITIGYTGTGSAIVRSISDTRTAYKDTEFHAKVALGIPLLRMPFVRSLSDKLSCTYGIERKDGRVDYYAAQLSYIPSRSALDMYTLAAQDFYNKAMDKQYFDLGVSLAEFPETIGLIASTATRFARVFQRLKRLDISGAFSALGIRSTQPTYLRDNSGKIITARRHRKMLQRKAKSVKDVHRFAAQSWLEMRYGWQPIIFDTYNIAQYVADTIYRQPYEDIISKGVASIRGTALRASTIYSNGGECHQICRYDASYRISNKAIRNVANLGLTNPANIAWELMPFSFVIDWFLPVGNYMKSFSVFHGLQLVSCSSTYVERMDFKCSIISPGHIPGAEGHFKMTYITRAVERNAPSVPLPNFSLYERLNGYRIADAISLMRVIFGK